MKRPITAELHRAGRVIWTRHYARVSTALPRALQVLILEGHPRDTIAFSHQDLGFEIGTLRIHAGGKIVITLTGSDPSTTIAKDLGNIHR